VSAKDICHQRSAHGRKNEEQASVGVWTYLGSNVFENLDTAMCVNARTKSEKALSHAAVEQLF